MSSAPPADEVCQTEVERLRRRVADLERERQVPLEILEKSPVMISVVRAPDFTYELVNPAFQALAPGKKFLGRKFADVWAELSEPLVETLQRVIETGEAFRLEDAPYSIVRSPGAPPEVVYVTYSWTPLAGPDGKPDRILTLAVETTGSVRQRQQLEESSRSLQTMSQTMSQGVVFQDTEGKVLSMNPAAESILGKSPGEFVGYTSDGMARECIREDGSPFPGLEHPSVVALATGREVRAVRMGVYNPRRKQYRWIEIGAVPLFRAGEAEPYQVYTVFEDITERKRVEEEMAWLASFPEQNRNPVTEIEQLSGLVRYANPAARRLLPELLQQGFSHPWFAGLERAPAAGLAGQDRGGGLREVFVGDRWFAQSVAHVADKGRLRVYGIDITERKLAEEALRESEALMRSFFDSGEVMRGIVELIDGSIVHVSCNAPAARLYGVDRNSIAGKTAADAGAPEPVVRAWIGLYEESRRTGKPVSMEYARRDAEGRDRWMLATASYLGDERSGNPRFAYTIIDLTDRKRAEEALRESVRRERFLAEILESSEQPFAIGYPDGRLGICNRAYCDLTGYSLEELQSVTWTTLLTPPEWMEKEMTFLAELERTGRPVRYEKEYVRKDGRRVPVELLVHAARDESGEVEFYYSFLTDITERRRTSEALAKSRDDLELRVRERTRELSVANQILSAQIEERERAQTALHESELAFRTLAESMPQMVWICNPDGLTVYFNQRWVEYTGLTLEESYGTGWNQPFHPDDKQPAWHAWSGAVRTGDAYHIESRLRRADGVYHWFLMRGVPHRDAAGQIVKWFGTCTDIDDLKQAEQAAQQAKERLAMSLKVGHSGTFEWDLGSKVTWTPELEELYGLAPGAFGGTYEEWETMVVPGDLERIRAVVEESLKTGEFISEWRIRRKGSDEIRWIAANAKVFFDEAGRPVRMIGFNRDITDRKRAEQEVLRLNQDLERSVAERTAELERTAEELEKRNREVERVNRMKTEFLARSSHELRTPLNAIVGYSDLLGEQSAGPLPDPYPRFVANIQDGARHLLDMVNDLLDLSRIEAGRIELNLERFEVSAVLDEVVSVIAPLARIKSIAVESRVAPGTVVVADRVRFKQILYNLMSNAVKFTPEEGRVWVESAANGEMFTVSVGDTGVGIAPSEQEAIFEEFHQAASGRKLGTAGAGLGLAITRKLARLHGGDVRVESEMNKGSRFLVWLPVAADSHAPE